MEKNYKKYLQKLTNKQLHEWKLFIIDLENNKTPKFNPFPKQEIIKLRKQYDCIRDKIVKAHDQYDVWEIKAKTLCEKYNRSFSDLMQEMGKTR